MAEYTRQRKPRNPTHQITTLDPDPNPNRFKPTISSILLNEDTTTKKKTFSSASFRGLGCTVSSQVSVPTVIRTSADWEPKKLTNKRVKTKKSSKNNPPSCNTNGNPVSVTSNGTPLSQSSLSLALSSSCVGTTSNDVWCGPGIGLDTDAASVDCVVSRRPVARGKLDGRSACSARRLVTPDNDIRFLETETILGMPRFHSDNISTSRRHRYDRPSFGEGLAEIVMLQRSVLMRGRLSVLDRYRDLRLDIDNMSYEELLELGDHIGYVSTGLRDDDIMFCLKRSKIVKSLFATEMERKCSICQEEYEEDDETGKLIKCEHFYHIECIKQWLGQKNNCPICKTEALPKI